MGDVLAAAARLRRFHLLLAHPGQPRLSPGGLHAGAAHYRGSGGVHGHDERISTRNLRLGTRLLLDTVRRAAGVV